MGGFGSPLAIDLETVPTAWALARPYPEAERQPPANYSKPDSIAAWREKDRQAWETDRIKQYSLSPLYGRIVAVGLAQDPPGDFSDAINTHALLAPSEEDEPTLLRELFHQIAQADGIVTWNGEAFDVPFLLTRAAYHRIMPPYYLDRHVHVDVKRQASGGSYDALRRPLNSLDDWAQAFGLGAKTAGGDQVYGMYREGRYEDIGAYAAHDARLTLELYHRLASVFG